jgi:PilZ domain
MEHRCGIRHPTDLSVVISARDGCLSSRGQVSDISLSGCFVHTALPVGLLSRIVLQLSSDHSSARLEGCVVRLGEQGLAVEWQDYSPELLRLLRQRDLAVNIEVAALPTIAMDQLADAS